MPLRTDPLRRVVVPLVTVVGDLRERGLDVVPASLVLKASPHQLGDDGAAPTSAGAPIELTHQLVVQRYVQTHVLRLAHNGARGALSLPPGEKGSNPSA